MTRILLPARETVGEHSSLPSSVERAHLSPVGARRFVLLRGAPKVPAVLVGDVERLDLGMNHGSRVAHEVDHEKSGCISVAANAGVCPNSLDHHRSVRARKAFVGRHDE